MCNFLLSVYWTPHYVANKTLLFALKINLCNKDPNAVVLGIKGVHNIEYYMILLYPPSPHIADTLLQT